jgi:Ca2+-binding EF-hand superfamily protein
LGSLENQIIKEKKTMSGRALVGLLAGLVVTMASLGASAAETAPPDQGSPQVLFGWLDKNHDGTIAADEITVRLPESTKDFVQKADKNGDKKVTLDELKEAFKSGAPPRPWLGDDGYEHYEKSPPKEGVSAPSSAPHGTPPPLRPGRPRVPSDWSTLFKALDKNHDGSLSNDEFTAGMHEFFPPIGIRARLARMEKQRAREADWESELDEELGISRDERSQRMPVLRGAWRLLREWGPPPWHDRDWVGDESGRTEQSRQEPAARQQQSLRPSNEQPWWFAFIPPGPRGDRLRDLISTAVRQEVDSVFKERFQTARPPAEYRQNKGETQPGLKK